LPAITSDEFGRFRVYAAEAIEKYDACVISSANGRLYASLADGTTILRPNQCIMYAKYTVALGDLVEVAPILLATGVDTSGGVAKAPVYLSTSTAGKFQVASSAYMVIGTILEVSATVGEVLLHQPYMGDLLDIAGLVVSGEVELQEGTSRRDYAEHYEEFMGASGATPPIHLATDFQTTSITGDYEGGTAADRNGVYTITSDATSEAQAGQVTNGNTFLYSASVGTIFECAVKINFAGTEFSADERFVVGLCSTHTNAEDSLDDTGYNCWFRIEGADLSIFAEADDTSVDVDDEDTGIDIVDDTWTNLRIEFVAADEINFYVDDVLGATISTVTIPDPTALQFIMCYQRDAGDEIEECSIDFYRVAQAR